MERELSTEPCVCSECGREIEECAACGGRCGKECCHRDLLFSLRESIPQPHVHGG